MTSKPYDIFEARLYEERGGVVVDAYCTYQNGTHFCRHLVRIDDVSLTNATGDVLRAAWLAIHERCQIEADQLVGV